MYLKFTVLISIFVVSMAQVPMPILQRLKSVRTLEDFLSMVTKDGHPMTPEDVYPHAAVNSSTGEKQYISGGLVLAASDECSPRLMSVEIPKSGYDSANTVYWPECTKVRRCGGCCPSGKLKCVPAYTEMTTLHVLKAVAREQGSLNLDWVGPLAVAIEEHYACRLTCRLSPEDCKYNQTFDYQECSCRCPNQPSCSPPLVFDSTTCSCVCNGDKTCPTNTVYDESQCKCVILEEAQETNIAISGTLSQADIDAYMQANNGHLPSASLGSDQRENARPPTTTTTTTTTTTAAPTTRRPPCADTRCPRGWRTIRRGEHCLCTP